MSDAWVDLCLLRGWSCGRAGGDCSLNAYGLWRRYGWFRWWRKKIQMVERVRGQHLRMQQRNGNSNGEDSGLCGD